MKKILLLLITSPMLLFGQVQIGSDIDGEASGDRSGQVSLSSDGTIVAIGADQHSISKGHTRIYSNQNGVWSQIGSDIDGEASGDQSGFSISLSSDGMTLAIGTVGASQGGYASIYTYQNGEWTQIGSNIVGEALGDGFGFSVSLSSDGTIVAVGALLNDGNGSDSGHVRIFKNINDTWTQVGSDIDGETAGDNSSEVSLSSDGNIIAIGAGFNDGNGSNSGHVRIFKNINDTWTQVGEDIDGESAGDYSGLVSLSSDGNIIAIGALRNDGNGLDSGHVRIFKNINDTWTQVGSDIDGEEAEDESSRVSLSSDATTVAIGARTNDGNGSDSGHVRIYDLSSTLSVDNFILSNININPNPAKENVKIELKDGVLLQNINIYNNLGQFIIKSKKLKVNTSNLKSGLYFLEIITNKGISSKKLIIE